MQTSHPIRNNRQENISAVDFTYKDVIYFFCKETSTHDCVRNKERYNIITNAATANSIFIKNQIKMMLTK